MISLYLALMKSIIMLMASISRWIFGGFWMDFSIADESNGNSNDNTIHKNISNKSSQSDSNNNNGSSGGSAHTKSTMTEDLYDNQNNNHKNESKANSCPSSPSYNYYCYDQRVYNIYKLSETDKPKSSGLLDVMKLLNWKYVFLTLALVIILITVLCCLGADIVSFFIFQKLFAYLFHNHFVVERSNVPV